jgi:hypothetical protein
VKLLRNAESARYAVLRRLAPAIRHGMVGRLHPMGLVSSAMSRRLQSSQDLEHAREGLQKINEMSRTALDACTGLIDWIAPEAGDCVSLQQGVDECLALLGTELGMRGHTLEHRSQPGEALVARSAVQQVLAAVLLALMDAEPDPIDLQLRIESGNGEGRRIVLALTWTRSSRPPMPAAANLYRTISWEDVALLADAEGVDLQRSDQSLELHFDRLQG